MARRTLNQMETFKLMGLIEKDYKERRQSDADFAAYAADALTIPAINDGHVMRCRQTLGIPATLYAKSATAKAQADLNLEALVNAEKRLCALELKVENLEKLLEAWKQLFPNLKVKV